MEVFFASSTALFYQKDSQSNFKFQNLDFTEYQIFVRLMSEMQTMSQKPLLGSKQHQEQVTSLKLFKNSLIEFSFEDVTLSFKFIAHWLGHSISSQWNL